jgi:D-sedoheptulose 7-phosphate isomerase
LRTCLEAGDVVYAMSVSGNSENIIRAMDYAKEVGATRIGLCGFNGGRLKDHCDICLHIPTEPDEYGPVEDIFAIMDHIVTGHLTMKRGKRLHH